MVSKEHYVIITAIGTDNLDLIHHIAKLCAKYACHIQDSKYQRLGNDVALLMSVRGSWHAIAKIEATIPQIKKQSNSDIICRRTHLANDLIHGLPYQAQLIAEDKPGILSQICSFFLKNNIHIDDCTTQTYTPASSTTKMCQLQINVRLPTKCHLASLRDKFFSFCDDHNLDALLEPLK